MKLKDRIVNSKILDSNQQVEIEANYNKKNKEIKIYVTLLYAINLKMYKELMDLVINSLKPLEDKLEYSVGIGYKDSTISDDELFEYLNLILDDLSKSDTRFRSFNLNEARVEDNNIIFDMPYDIPSIDSLINSVSNKLNDYGFNYNVSINYDRNKSIEEQKQELDNKLIEESKRQEEEAKKFNDVNNNVKNSKKNYVKYRPEFVSQIKSIPVTSEAMATYKNEEGNSSFLLEGYVYSSEYKTFPRSKNIRATFKLTDETDSIMVCRWMSPDEANEYRRVIDNDLPIVDVSVMGEAIYDMYLKQVIIEAKEIKVLNEHKFSYGEDNEPVKRVEFNVHTKMSTLDGVTDPEDYYKIAKAFGFNSLALTDTNGVYGVPDFDHKAEKDADFKPIYGAEMSYVDDYNFKIAFNDKDIILDDATYVVFDIETTGFSQEYDRIIEIAAFKVKHGDIIETYDTFVNPRRIIPEKITELTSIRNDMVENAPDIIDALNQFLEFSKDSILVAHNASFDIGHIYKNMEREGIAPIDFPVIDTLNLFRGLHGAENKNYNLKVLSKFYKVKQEQHHRADDDTRVLALCFVQMLYELEQKNIKNYNEINNLIGDDFYKYVIPSKIDIIAKNKVGYKNLLKILSESLTTNLYKDARCLRSVIDKYREGILLGSSVQSDVFENVLNRTVEEAKDVIKTLDYVEILPPNGYKQYFSSLPNGEDDIKDILRKIIEISKELNKPIIAVSGAHYGRPNEKKYYEILVQAPQMGGGIHRLAKADLMPDLHLRTTREMLDEFDFLDKNLAYEIVVENTNKLADEVQKYDVFYKDTFVPADDEFKDNFLHVPSIIEESKRIVHEHLIKSYGDDPHPMVTERLNRELNSIISNGYISVYYMSHLMVVKSLSDGYLVGSRGSVGSSFVATMMDITEINPLAPHYICKNCKFQAFKMNKAEVLKYGIRDIEKDFQDDLQKADSGYDLPDRICPICGNKLSKDGHDIPFETFLGFNGDKTPDIDLNFSGEYQPRAHEYIREVFGPDNAFRAGTVATVAEKNAYGIVKDYLEKTNSYLRRCEEDRISSHLIGVRRSTGQHPGGIVVVPHMIDIYDVTPVQYPADNDDSNWRTTHYDYHKFEKNLLKLDVLGHDDPTIIKYLMDYVHLHQEEFPFSRPQDIPVDDQNVYKLFRETSVLGLTEAQEMSKVGSFGVPEFGTQFVRQMLVDTRPDTFAKIVKISGFSHGTGIWQGNAQELIGGKTEFGSIDFKDAIGCRDDIMVQLLNWNLEPNMAFEIMEFVRKNKKVSSPDKWEKFKNYMREKEVPEWYIWSCEKIEYMFPKAHATAYVLMALRIAWFKVYYPILFYSAWLSKRAKAHDVKAYVGGKIGIKAKINEINNTPADKKTNKDDDVLISLQIANEAAERGIRFLPVDINKSDSINFIIEDGCLRIPFIAVDKLGESVANQIKQAREEKPYTSKKDVMERSKLNQTLFEEFEFMHAFGNLPDEEEKEEVVTQDLFSFL